MAKNWTQCKCGEEGCEYEPSELYWHEALDRSSVATDHFHEFIEEHAVVMHNEELAREAEYVTEIMYKFYCLIAERSLEWEERNK